MPRLKTKNAESEVQNRDKSVQIKVELQISTNKVQNP